MAYIAKANSYRIIQEIDLLKIDLKGNVYKRPISFFSRFKIDKFIKSIS